MNYYIIFERIDDPSSESPVAVFTDQGAAEERQLFLQQNRADAFNEGRENAFYEDRGFAPKKTAADYNYRFRVEEVK